MHYSNVESQQKKRQNEIKESNEQYDVALSHCNTWPIIEPVVEVIKGNVDAIISIQEVTYWRTLST